MYYPGGSQSVLPGDRLLELLTRQRPDAERYWSLMAEVCESPYRPVDESSLRDWVLAAMRKDGLIGADADVVSFWHRRVEHGYPTPFLGRDEVLGR